MAMPPQTPRPTTEPNKDGLDAAAYVETQRRLNELEGKLINYREKAAGRSFNGLAIILGLVGIIVALGSYIGFERVDRIRTEIRQQAKEAEAEIRQQAKEAEAEIRQQAKEAEAEIRQQMGEAERLVSEIEKQRDRAVEVTDDIDNRLLSLANTVEEQNPQLQAWTWFSIGSLYGERDNWKAAIEAYNIAIKLNRDYTAAYNNRGTAKYGLRQYDKAIVDFTTAIKLNRDYAAAYNNRGAAKNALRQYAEAIVDLTTAIKLDRRYIKAYNNRGAAKESLNLIPEARADYQQALSLAQAANDEDLVAAGNLNLRRLDRVSEVRAAGDA